MEVTVAKIMFFKYK